MASGILNLFPPETMTCFLEEVNSLTELWGLEEEEERELSQSITDDLNHLRLIRTAYVMSKLASVYCPLLKRINERYPKFWEICDEIKRKCEQ